MVGDCTVGTVFRDPWPVNFFYFWPSGLLSEIKRRILCIL